MMKRNMKEIQMLTLAYCRVSTEEQAEEGYSIDGQADKLRAYATLRDLGEVVVVADPGRSGKDMKRPGLQQLLAAVESSWSSTTKARSVPMVSRRRRIASARTLKLR
jgi:site-specific DNA recombinase